MDPFLIFYPPYEGKFYQKGRAPFPIGPLYLAAYLEKKGIPSVVYDCSYPPNKTKTPRPSHMTTKQIQYWRWGWTDAEIKSWLKKNLKKYHSVVGVSCLMSSNYTGGYNLIRLIKEVSPKTKVIMGGPHVTAFPEHAAKESLVDYIVIGEGEEILYNFLTGGSYEIKDKIITRKEKISFIKDMDSLPFPRRDLLKDDRKLDEVYITFSRGCPHKCSFCGSYLIQGRVWRHKSVDRVVEEIKFYMNEWGVKKFIVEDDNVTPGTKGIAHWKAICRRLLEDKQTKKGLRFDVSHGFPAYATADQELCDLLYKVGFRNMSFPLESTNPETLKDMKKEFTPDGWRKSIKAWHYEKNRPAQIILGYPFVETIETMLKTMIDISQMKGRIWASHFRLNRGTELFDRCVEAKYVPANYDPINSQSFFIETERFNINDLKELRQIARGINFGTTNGVDVMTCPIDVVLGNQFHSFRVPQKPGDIVARGQFSFRKGQNVFATLLLMRAKKYRGRPFLTFEDNESIVFRQVNESRVYMVLSKMLRENRYIKRR